MRRRSTGLTCSTTSRAAARHPRPTCRPAHTHGFIFEVPSSPRPLCIRAGRFAHEAVAFDHSTGFLYLTEDDFGFPSGFYKYIPPVHPRLRRSPRGRWLVVDALGDGPAQHRPLGEFADRHSAAGHLGADRGSGPFVPDEWWSADGGQRRRHPPRRRAGWGRARRTSAGSRARRSTTERSYFCSTQGGGEAESADISTARPNGYGMGFGQIWAYRTHTVLEEPLSTSHPGHDVLDFPDNVTVKQARRHIVLCEDSTDFNYLRLLSRQGQVPRLHGQPDRRPRQRGVRGGDVSPGGDTLYVNIQAAQGLSIAIWGVERC